MVGKMRKHVLPFFLFALFTVWVRAPSFVADTLDIDETVWMMGARIMIKGGEIYRDFVDNKPPGIFFIYYLVAKFIGDKILYVHIVSTLVNLVTGLIAYRLFLLIFSQSINPYFVLLLYTGFSSCYVERHFLAGNTETFMNLFFALMLLSILKGLKEGKEIFFFLGGILGGLSFLIRQTCGVMIGFTGLFLLIRKKGLMRGFLFGTGLLLPLILTAYFFYKKELLSDFIYWVFGTSYVYVRVLGNSGADFLHNFLEKFFPFLILISPLLFFSLKIVVKKGIFYDEGVLYLFIILLSTFLSISAGGRFYPHYFLQLFPSLIPLAIAGFSLQKEKLFKPFLAFFFLISFSFPIAGLWRVVKGDFEEVSVLIDEVSTYIKARTNPSDTIFVWGFGTIIYYKAERFPATRYILATTNISGYGFGNKRIERGEIDPRTLVREKDFEVFISELKRNLPVYFVDYSEHNYHFFGPCKLELYPALYEFLKNFYFKEREIGKIVLYRRRG